MNFESLPLIHFKELDSTNAEAMRMLKHGKPAEGTCLVAEFQSEGRGQRSNNWISRPGENLLVSFILYPPVSIAQRPFALSKTIALAVQQTIQTFTSESVEIKWPNDILINGKKVAGILIENQWSGSTWQAAVAGIGINVNQTEFSIEKATSLALHHSNGLEVMTILKELQRQLSRQYSRLFGGEEAAIDTEYGEKLFGKQEYHTYNTSQGNMVAKVIAVGNDGKIELLNDREESNHFDLHEAQLIY